MKILIIAMPGCGNFGDDIISETLQKKILNLYPEAYLGILCGEASSFRILANSRKLYIPRNLPGKLYSRIKAIKDFVKESDMIFIGGGGLFQDTHNFFTIHFYLHWLIYASCPVYCVGVGVGPIKYKFNQEYLKRVLKRKGIKIQLRDIESYNVLNDLDINNIDLSCDIVEGADLNFIKKTSSQKTLGCSIRQWADFDLDTIVRLINDIAHNNKIERIKLFAFEHSSLAPIELTFLHKIAEKLELPTTILAYGMDDNFISELCCVDIAIASRYHANIIWQKIRVPTMPIPYAPKVYSLYSKAGVYLQPISSDRFKEQFYRIDISDKYTLPLLDLVNVIHFSFFEKLIVKIIGIVYFLCSIFKSIKTRLFVNL